ncbi:phage tail tape measure protein [Bacteroides sp. AN502(2024)]|uniref:phage tail tape measure protein n=1 Tax=Bacteroides sp. AN502(2024) TaxID=3160599 RepID=UPI00351414D6
MAGESVNVSFEETNAAIQVLDKAGKKGSEGGVALRNVLSTLAAGRFLPEKTQEELQKAGINVSSLTDKTKPLKERLETLKPLLKDDALLSPALFGRENANAALALINGTESLQDFTDAVTGTSSAEEQAAIIMESYAERQARINQQFEDFKISIFQAMVTSVSGFHPTGALVPLSQLMPLLIGMGNLMTWIKGLQWAAMWSHIQGFIYAAVVMAFMNRELITGQFASNGFLINITLRHVAGALVRQWGFQASRSGRAGSVLCHGWDSFGHFRECRLRLFWCVQSGGCYRLPRGQCGHHEHPDHRVDSRGHCRPCRSGCLLLEHVGEVPRYLKKPPGEFCRHV